MKAAGLALALAACSASSSPPKSPTPTGRYATIGPLRMYYEVHGAGAPLVLIHGGGSTIQTSYRQLLPRLAAHYQVIAVELQGHGHTADVDRPITFAQDADDVAALLGQLGVSHAGVIGFSNGATTAIVLAIRHPAAVSKIVAISGALSSSGFTPELHAGFAREPSPDDMPAELRAGFFAVAPHPEQLPAIVTKEVMRMRHFEDLPTAQVRAITAPALVIGGDRDVMTPEHAVAIFRAFTHAQLAILPATDHAQIMERADRLLALIEPFLAE